MQYQQALAWLYGTQLHGIKLGLENVRRLLAEIGFCEGPRFIHVAGTNGKGSVCAMVEAMARAGGVRTGLFTSPHLISFRERICITGEMISERAVATGLTKLREIVAGWDPHPTFFELTTVLALMYFQQEQADLVALETGLGGRLDATNAINPVVSVLTSIGLDHQAWLGTSLREIAEEKAGIIKHGVPVISAPQMPAAATVIEQAAAAKHAPLTFITAPYAGAVSLRGSHQRLNAAIAISALRRTCPHISEEAIRLGLMSVNWPGRFEILGDRVVVDGAHNAPAAERLAVTWMENFPNEKATLILGVLADKDAAAIFHALAPITARVIATKVGSTRTAAAGEVAEIIHRHRPWVPCSIAPDLRTALEDAETGANRVLITGSLFLVGEALALLRGGAGQIERSAQ
jgi:dihydrofolate synthase/folylpolyglutamate synthase